MSTPLRFGAHPPKAPPLLTKVLIKRPGTYEFEEILCIISKNENIITVQWSTEKGEMYETNTLFWNLRLRCIKHIQIKEFD